MDGAVAEILDDPSLGAQALPDQRLKRGLCDQRGKIVLIRTRNGRSYL
jgi:hypothetical protein